MLVNMKEMLLGAVETHQVVPGFNVLGYDDATLVTEVEEEVKAPAMRVTNRDAAHVLDLPY